MPQKHLFRIPITSRFASTLPEKFHGQETRAIIDGKGYCLYYNPAEFANPEEAVEFFTANLKTLSYSYSEDTIHIWAESLDLALEEFFTNWQGSSFFPNNSENNAIWINCEKTIIELPYCDKLHVHPSSNKFVCGQPVLEPNCSGELGYCVVENYDPPYGCPIHHYYTKYSKQHKIINFQGLNFNPGLSPEEIEQLENVKSQ